MSHTQGHRGHQGHSDSEVVSHFAKIGGHRGHDQHNEKKGLMFDTIHGMIVRDKAACLALGATEAMLEPITNSLKAFEANRATIIATDLS